MSMTLLRFLLLEDSPLDIELIQTTLAEGDLEYELLLAQTRAEFMAALETETFDLILSDYSLPGFDGIAALQIAARLYPQVPFIFVSATLGEELAIEALKLGATDYVLKQRLARLVPAILRALREAQERRDRQQAEAALRQNEARFQRLFQANLIGCFFWQIDGRILDANPSFLRMVGYTRTDLEAGLLNWRAMTPPSQIAWSERSLSQMQQGGVAETLEKEYICKDGSRVPVLLGGVMFEHSTNQGVSYVVDLREHKRHEAEQLRSARQLQQHHEKLKLLFETTSNLLSTEKPLTLMNALFEKLSAQMDLHCYFNFLVEGKEPNVRLRLECYGGVSPEEIKPVQQIEFGQYICGLVAQERRQIVLDRVQESNHPHSSAICSLGITAYAGQPLIAQGRLLGTLSFASKTRTHFTPEEVAFLQATSDQVAIALERAELLASLQQQTEQLSRANRIKDEFLAVLSHELRTPLNPILGWAKILRTRPCDETTTTRALEAIERNAKVQTQLIDDLLDVSRILQGKLRFASSQVDLTRMVEAALETVQLSAQAKSIQICFQANNSMAAASQNQAIAPLAEPNLISGPRSEYLVLGDAGRLQQVIWNLLSNAVKFTPSEGRIQVTLSVITEGQEEQCSDAPVVSSTDSIFDQPKLMTAATATYAQIAVSDTGSGIDPDFLPHMFDYFRQSDSGSTRAFGGLGLGLAIANHIIQAHGGMLQAKSAGLNQGATFLVKLPLLKQPYYSLAGPLQAASDSSSLKLKNLRILVVDDEADTLELMVYLLEQEGAIISSASSVREALIQFEQMNPDFLITDIAMPGEDGFSLLRKAQLLMTRNHRQIPAIALTAYATTEDRSKALAAGFWDHFAKPVQGLQLIDAIAQIMDQTSG